MKQTHFPTALIQGGAGKAHRRPMTTTPCTLRRNRYTESNAVVFFEPTIPCRPAAIAEQLMTVSKLLAVPPHFPTIFSVDESVDSTMFWKHNWGPFVNICLTYPHHANVRPSKVKWYVCATKIQYVYTMNAKKEDPVWKSSSVWISCAPELEIRSVFESIEYRIVLVSFKVDTIRFLDDRLLA